jgi:hypothetical protein
VRLGAYHFFSVLTGEELPDEDACTLDAAMLRACKLSTSCGYAVGVLDVRERPARTRGAAVVGKWKWAIDCPNCSGSGQIQIPYGTSMSCGVCDGKGWRLDV